MHRPFPRERPDPSALLQVIGAEGRLLSPSGRYFLTIAFFLLYIKEGERAFPKITAGAKDRPSLVLPDLALLLYSNSNQNSITLAFCQRL